MSWKKIIIISSLILVALIALLFIIISSTRFKVLVAYNRLALSSYREVACHEQCFVDRRKYHNILLNYYDKKFVSEKIKQAILSEEENLNFRQELILVLSEKYDNSNTPQYLIDYLSAPDSSWQLKQEILSYFQISGFNLASDLEMIIYSDASDDDKSLAINALIGIADDKYFPAFVEVLKASSSANLFRAAAIALSNISDKEKYFSVDFINYLKDLLYLENLSPKRKKDIIYLLGDASQFSNLAKNILTTASTDNNLDDYSRYFASQAISLSVDDLSPKQWQVFSLIN